MAGFRDALLRDASLALIVAVVLLSAVTAGFAASAAAAQEPRYQLHVTAPDDITPSYNLAPAASIAIDAEIENVGSVPLSGEVTLTDTFPAGIVPVEPEPTGISTSYGLSCHIIGQQSVCTLDVNGFPPGAIAHLVYKSMVEPSAKGQLVNRITASGGGMPQELTSSQTMTVGPPGPFQIKSFAMELLNAELQPETQAGGDPAQVTSVLGFRGYNDPFFGVSVPSEHLKDVIVHTPAGVIGDPTAASKCSSQQLGARSLKDPELTECPVGSQVGVVYVYTSFGRNEVELFNLVPPVGHPAAFGFRYKGVTVLLTARLRPSDDGVDIVSLDSVSTLPVALVEVSLWGVPAESGHDYVRGTCGNGFEGNVGGQVCPSEGPRRPFLRTPTSCTGSPLQWSTDITTYTHPNASETVHAETTTPAMTGCERLPFALSFSLAPGELLPHVPSAVDATLTMPQETAPEGLAESDLRTATVTLPEGVSINPSSAGGLEACSDGDLRLGVDGVATCPDASKIGTLTVTTPMLDHALEGSIFLRSQASTEAASGDMFRVALEVRSDNDGIDVKLPAQIKVDPSTGRLTTVIADSPQLPFSSVALHFKDGPRAPLSTPRTCGTYTTSSTFTSWSGKTVSKNSHFTISGDGHGAPCAPSGFAPVLKAGTVNNRAAASSPFVLRLTRTDADQPLSTLSSLTMPPGLTGSIASVPVRCTDVQVAAAACPTQSRVGNVTVGVGTGPAPFYITDGNAYLTGPYNGAPFGLAFVVHAKAGPFDLGNVIVRAAIQIDPHTAQVKVLSDPLPSIVKGVPVQLRDLRVTIDRPGFMLNPTGCKAMQITGTVTGAEGSSANVSSRFQAADCATLKFKPGFKVSTSAKHSRLNGASLHVVVTSGSGQANIKYVHVSLPKAMPSRLETLQKACADSVFDANPSACPAESRVGTAKAVTPLLASPLSGPVYFVSHGGAKFPELISVLQGEGVTVDLSGETFINEKTGITSSTFRSVPDTPITRFDLTLPMGHFSALTLTKNPCKTKLAMPTIIKGQNGALIERNTKIAVSGCPKAKKAHKARKGSKRKHARK